MTSVKSKRSPTPTPSKMPTPAAPPRYDGWTRAKMVAFLRELAATQSVSAAARSVGMSRTSAYNLRNRLQGTPFALGWEVALEMGFYQLAQTVMDRAVNGVEVPHYYRGELVGSARRFDNHLARWVLNNPWKVGRQQVAREYSGQSLDGLLERIEWASLDWEAGEPLPGRYGPGGVPPASADDSDPDDAGADGEEDAEMAEQARLKRITEMETRFTSAESWYSAEAEVMLGTGAGAGGGGAGGGNNKGTWK